MRTRTRFGLPSHTTLVAYAGLFIAIGGSAYAATQLPKNSVGTRQLKKKAVATSKLKGNAVTKNKIKRNAIVRAKIRNNAVNAAKIADNSVTGSEINAATTPFARIVHSARGEGPVPVPKEEPAMFPLSNHTYTQEANRDDSFVGAVDVTFLPSCTPPRQAFGIILLDPANPNEPDQTDAVSFGIVQDEAGGEVSKRVNIGGSEIGGGSFQRDVAVNHSFYLGVLTNCAAGEGAVATYGAIDVIGVK